MSDPAHDSVDGRRRNALGAWAFAISLAAVLAAVGDQQTLTLNLSAVAIFGGFVGFFEGQRRGLRRLFSVLAMTIGLVTLALVGASVQLP